MPFLLSYTRKEIDSVFYDARIAFSLHLAVSKDGKNFVALNNNSGVLFAKASENDDGSLNPKTLGFPIIVSKNDLQELGIVSFDDGFHKRENKKFMGKYIVHIFHFQLHRTELILTFSNGRENIILLQQMMLTKIILCI